MPTTNMTMAVALMVCITFKLKLVGLLGSFFLKKYMVQTYKKKGSGKTGTLRQNFMIQNYFTLNSTRRFITRPSSVELSAIGIVSP